MPHNKRAEEAFKKKLNTDDSFINSDLRKNKSDELSIILSNESVEDLEMIGATENDLQNTYNSQWNKSIQVDTLKYYSKNSRTTFWRKQVAIAKMIKNGQQQLRNFGSISVPKENKENSIDDIYEKTKNDIEIENIKLVLTSLKDDIKPTINLKDEKNNKAMYHFAKSQSIYIYFMNRLDGFKRFEAAKIAADSVWLDPSKEYCPKAIIKWPKEYISDGKLSGHRQGAHAKRHSFLNNSDVKIVLLNWIRQ